MKKTVLTFGLISGAVLSAMMVITLPLMEHIAYERSMIIGYSTMVAAGLLIFFGIRAYRDNVGGGEVSFKRALAVGALIALISSICYTVTWEVIFYGFRPDFTVAMEKAQVDRARAKGGTPAEIDKQIAEIHSQIEAYKNPLVNIAFTMIEPLPVGLIISLVSAGILSRRRRGVIPQLA